jgi:4-hydroxy-3-polyprenylbenzoate decarboxylase
MVNRDLHDFLERLERLGELQHVRVEVDPCLEIAEITGRVCKAAGKALLFDKVKGSAFPVATNLFGSARRLAEALGVDDFKVPGERLAELLAELPAGPLEKKLAAFPVLHSVAHLRPEIAAQAPCQQVVEDEPDLTRYPFLKGWPDDGLPHHGGRFITLPLVFTRDHETGLTNCGMYRVDLFDARRGGIHWYAGRGGEHHYRTYQACRERMPVAVALGGAPALLFAAMLPLPDGLDEMHFAGFLQGAPVEMVRCRTSELSVPAHAELIIEGYLEPGENELDGAFGNHTGFYAPPAEVPVLHVTCITRRRDCICPATVVGRPPMEDSHLARAMWRMLLPLVQLNAPGVVDINFPPEWIFHTSGVVSVKRTGPATGRETLAQLWQSAWLRAARLLVVVDADQNIDDLAGVAWRVINNVDWSRDLIVTPEVVKGVGAAGFPWGGSRLGIDATRKDLTSSGLPWPAEIRMDDAVKRLVDGRWKEYGF